MIGGVVTSSDIAMSEKMRGKGTDFERIRRITGYLVGTLDRFNNGKRAEEHDRIKHGVSRLDYIEAEVDTQVYAMATSK